MSIQQQIELNLREERAYMARDLYQSFEDTHYDFYMFLSDYMKHGMKNHPRPEYFKESSVRAMQEIVEQNSNDCEMTLEEEISSAISKGLSLSDIILKYYDFEMEHGNGHFCERATRDLILQEIETAFTAIAGHELPPEFD